MPHHFLLMLQLAAHTGEPCNPVVHILIELIVGPIVALVVVFYFRGSGRWREELPEFLVGALLSGILISIIFCVGRI